MELRDSLSLDSNDSKSFSLNFHLFSYLFPLFNLQEIILSEQEFIHSTSDLKELFFLNFLREIFVPFL